MNRDIVLHQREMNTTKAQNKVDMNLIVGLTTQAFQQLIRQSPRTRTRTRTRTRSSLSLSHLIGVHPEAPSFEASEKRSDAFLPWLVERGRHHQPRTLGAAVATSCTALGIWTRPTVNQRRVPRHDGPLLCLHSIVGGACPLNVRCPFQTTLHSVHQSISFAFTPVCGCWMASRRRRRRHWRLLIPRARGRCARASGRPSCQGTPSSFAQQR